MPYYGGLGAVTLTASIIKIIRCQGRRLQMSVKLRYSKAHKDYIVDELCQCGHLRRDHGSKSRRVGESLCRLPQHGNCCSGQCACPRFTWARFVTATEFAERFASLRSGHSGVLVKRCG